MPTKTFKHSGDLGDVIYSLPAIKYLGGARTLYLNPGGLKRPKYDGTPSGLSPETIKFIKPLLVRQQYIEKIEDWSNQDVDYNIDAFRLLGPNLRHRNLCEVILEKFNVPFNQINKPWIRVPSKPIAKEVFSRSLRYHNDRVSLKPFLEKSEDPIFVGHEYEWKSFCDEVGAIPFHKVEDAYEMAQIIEGCELFVGNQSFAMSLAVALHKRFVQEVCLFCTNCIFQRQGAIYLMDKPK